MIKDGLICKQGELKPYSGIVKDTIEGKIIEYEVVNGKKSGEFKTYFKNGKLEMLGMIKDNLNGNDVLYQTSMLSPNVHLQMIYLMVCGSGFMRMEILERKETL
jgi:hypothetical protein